MPHIHCYLDNQPLVWTMVLTDLCIGLSYIGISLTLFGLIKKTKISFSLVVFCFVVFIGACGATHFMEIWTLWYPDYWIAAFIKMITAVASVGTCIYLFQLRGEIFAVAESAKSSEIHRANLEDLTRELEQRVLDRTAEVVRNEQRYNLAMDAARVGIWEWDIKTDEVIWSRENAKLFGIDIGHGSAQKLSIFFQNIHSDDRNLVLQEMNEAVVRHQELRVEYRLQPRIDTNARWILSVGRADYDENDKPTRMFGTNTDITDLKAAEEKTIETQSKLFQSEQKFKLLANSIPQLSWVTGKDGGITWNNQRWYDYTGKKPEEMEGWSWEAVQHPDYLPRVMKKWKEHLLSGEDWEDTFPLKSANGEWRWFLSRAIPLRNDEGEILSWFGTNTDITENLINEQTLRESKELAESASRAKTQFLANMSHEIRTPVGAVIGFMDLMRNSSSDSERSEYMDIVERNSKNLLRLVDDILDLSKVESGKIAIERSKVSIKNLLSELATTIGIKAGEKGVEFIIESNEGVPEFIETDPLRLRQILVNLLKNAIKFTDTGRVTLSLDYRHPRMKFTVTDTGIGIPQEHIQNLFKPFAQGDPSMTRKYGGTGLGLILSQRLTQALGGDLYLVSSKPGHGSCFLASILAEPADQPDAPASARKSNKDSSAIKPLQGLRVVLVEDSEDNRFLLETYLTKAGASVDMAENGSIGVEKTLALQPDVVLMDLQMPVMDGYEATKKLRNSGFIKPIIAVTAHAMREERDRCISAGCTDYLTKPIQRSLLIEVLSRYV